MYCHLMVYMRIVLTTLVTITCLLGDNFVELTQHPLLRALVDNATHAVIGALSGIAFVVQFYDRTSNLFGWLLIFICFSVSSLIDVDHFIEARSWNLECHIVIYVVTHNSYLIANLSVVGYQGNEYLLANINNYSHSWVTLVCVFYYYRCFPVSRLIFAIFIPYIEAAIQSKYSCNNHPSNFHNHTAHRKSTTVIIKDATNLLRRPFLHCTTIPMMLLVLFVCTASLNYFKTSLILGSLLCAFVTHHTRDAVRRGYWMCPFGQTERIPHLFYIFTTILTPYIAYYLHCICRSSAVQQLLGNYVKLSDHHHHYRGYRYSTV